MKKQPSKICGNCKFYEQGEVSSRCGNPKQTDKKLKAYTYYPFQCTLFKKGIADSRLIYMENQEKKRREAFEDYMKAVRNTKLFATPLPIEQWQDDLANGSGSKFVIKN